MNVGSEDYVIAVPTVPGANTDFYLWDPDNDPDKNTVAWLATPVVKGLKGNVKFDQAVTLYVEEKANGAGAYVVVNNNGAGDLIPANTPTALAIAFLGHRTRIRCRTGGTPPSTSMIACRLTCDYPVV